VRGFRDVTIRNRSHTRGIALDLSLSITPHAVNGEGLKGTMPTRDDLAAIARRGLAPQAIFRAPVELAPRETLRRELVFVIRSAGRALSDREHGFALDVTDRLTGQTVSFALPAEYRG
jgi:hypothetical protein